MKNHYLLLLDLFEVQRSLREKKLAKLATTLEKHCSKIEDVVVNKAPASTNAVDLTAQKCNLIG